MRILFVTYRVPYPPVSGDRLRTFQLLSLLLKCGVEVFLITFVTSTSDQAHVRRLEEMGVQVTQVKLNMSWARVKAAVFSLLLWNVPLQCLIYMKSAMSAGIKYIVSEHKIDITYVFLARMGQYYIPGSTAIQILDYMDAFSEFYASRSLIGRKLSLSTLIDYVESKKLKRWEAKLLRQFDASTIITDYDALKISKDSPPVVIPPHVDDFLGYEVSGQPSLSSPSIILFGEMGTFYSECAVLFAVNQVMPIIWEHLPSATLYVVGSKPTKVITSLASPRVVITGFVDDMRHYIAKADVSIVPIFMGSGLKLKIIQSMALRVPVVSTSIANLGTNAEDGKHLLIADSAEKFAQSVILLLKDPAYNMHIADQAFGFVEERFGSKLVLNQLVNVFNRVGAVL